MPVVCEYFMLSGRGLCDWLFTRPEECYRVCVCVCVTECDHEASLMRRPRPDRAVEPREKKSSRNLFDK